MLPITHLPALGPLTQFYLACLVIHEHLSQCAPNYYHVDLVRLM